MDGTLLQTKIYKGFGIAAQKVGIAFNQYRATTPTQPLNSANMIGIQKVSTNVSWSYTKSNKFANAVYQMIVDGNKVQKFDIFTGVATYYICAMEPLQPILAVKCNSVMTLKRPTQPIGSGQVGYGGYLDQTSTIIMTEIPVSILEGTKGQNNEVKIPTDVKVPWWKILMPDFDNGATQILSGDIMTDDNGLRFEISSAEHTDMGWRLTAGQLDT